MGISAPKSVEVKLDLKFFSIGGTWEPNDAERQAAWEFYVELMTRISVVPLQDGIAREALASLYALFAEARQILRSYGPVVAEPKRDGSRNSFGFLTITILNVVLRPVLSHWHPELQVWEARRPAERSVKEHENEWARIGELRDVLEQTRGVLETYAATLATACGVPDLRNAVVPPPAV